jgi:putative membrane protein
MNTRPGLRTGAAVALAASLLATTPGASAGALASADSIVNRETVRVDLHPDGSKKVARLYSQLVVDGNGTIRVADPTSTEGLRDLDGFSKPRTEDGKAVWDLDVDGRAVRRTLADHKADLPVNVSVSYTLDGKDIAPGDVVGKDGLLKATYKVVNTTAVPTEVTYQDGKGDTKTATVSVPVPLVGSFRATLPGRFTQVDAPRADVVGDGRGNTTVSWSLVLFQPLGDPVSEFGWTAHVRDGIAPRGDVTIVPVLPSRKFNVGAYERGAAQASELTDGAGQIDANVLKLRDGAGELLAGLGQLAAGATTLQGGLSGSAAPGAGKLADGLGTAAAGGGKLADGLGDLSDGADRVAGGLSAANAGTRKLLDGSQDLAAGAGLVSTGAAQVADGLASVGDGLTQLSAAVSGLSANPGFLALKAGVTAMSAGLGSAGNPLTVLGALNAVELGLVQMSTSATAGLPAVVTGVQGLKAGLTNAKTAIATMAAAVTQQQALLADALVQGACAATPGSPLCVDVATAAGIAAAIKDGLTNADPALGLGAGVDAALAGIGSTSTPGATVLYGLSSAIAGIGSTSMPGNTLLYGLHQAILGLDHPAGAGGATDPGGIKQGMAAVGLGLDALVAGIVDAVDGALGAPTDAPTASLRGAVAALTDGAEAVADGTDAVAAGAGTLSNGALDLADGVDRLDTGAGQLAAGAGTAADGAGDLLDGLEQLKAGSRELANGLGSAADGSGRIADGLGSAKGGGKKLADGAGRLSKEGTSVLVDKGNATAADAAKTYATIKLLDAKAASNGLPYGAPEGGTGTAAYVLTLAAADGQATEDRGRALLALALVVAACAAGSVLRKRAVSW